MTLNVYKLTILLGFYCFSTLVVAEEIKVTPWVKVKAETGHVKYICNTLSLKCGNHVDVWKKKASTEDKLYLTDDTPQLFELSKVNNQYKLINSWRFDHYRHSSQHSPDDEMADYGTEIFPAFYPLNQKNFSIALVKKWGTSYAGGGRGEQIADFLMLEPNGKYKVALNDVAFYSYEMIRACFSERDYKISPHCHDESGSTLSIQFKDVGKPYYQWTLNYTDFTWESFKPEKAKKIEKYREVVMPVGQKAK
ncbi:hypothetical protein [Acinetobacter sp. WCHAc060025]|uniref:hypothetical protein n=1 Tax=Acinetobacter sp. WCHAc060025 TaxID=2518625 RepID=UPI001023A882|nr:hypothetical protein [Acinetobacter sp. WCHAc060025]RZG72308.1 hypothetical protein EXE09_17330 [Acinetobacter sp. WCHAc060025]